MPVFYHIYADEGVIVSRHVGKISDDELVEAYERLFEDSAFKLEYKKLVDLRLSRSKERSSEGLRAVADMVRKHHAGRGVRSRTAIVAPEDLYYGLARMYEALSDQSIDEVAVFRNPREASDWLEIRSDMLDIDSGGDAV